MKRMHWTLLVIAAADGDSLSPIQLQKCLFLLGEAIPPSVKGDYYRFKPYNYGPFDRDIYLDGETLEREGHVAIHRRPGQSWSCYQITSQGKKESERVSGSLPVGLEEYVQELVDWVRAQSFEALLGYIYEKYPAYASNSVFRVAR